MNDYNKLKKSESYFSNDARLNVNEKKYIQFLRDLEKKERVKKSRILNEEVWSVFPEYSEKEIKSVCYRLIEELDTLGINPLGVDVFENKQNTYIEPKFIVYLRKEFRGLLDEVRERSFVDVKTKGGKRELSVEYHIYN